MSTWPDTRILDLLGIEVPIIQAPMAGATTTAMVIAAPQGGADKSTIAAAPDRAEAFQIASAD